ncbi:MAG: autotransporter-associated beta strand repeat-containing protein [Planctomycetota bacterium]|nr:autotransporter-associated beta strand repeat-containing protein [Planctomycetota bacterium]
MLPVDELLSMHPPAHSLRTELCAPAGVEQLAVRVVAPGAVLCLVLLVLVGSANAGDAKGEVPERSKLTELGPLARKLDVRLIPHVKALRDKKVTARDAAEAIKQEHGPILARTDAADAFLVRLDCRVTDALLKQIAATGAVITHSTPQWRTVMALATLPQIDALSQVEGISFVSLELGQRRRQQGIADNHADIDMKADQVRSIYGLTGAGQTVGVLSDTLNRTAAVGAGTISGTVPNATLSLTKPQGTGDLPANIKVVDFGPTTGTDEGEGMLELIHDIAPNATLAFGSAYSVQTTFATNIGLLRTAAGCTITVDDVGYYAEPYFQDGPIAQAIRTNYQNGVIHFSAAGNDANRGVLTTCNATVDDAAWPPTGVAFHNWGIATGTPTFLPVTIAAHVTLIVVLQWNQPYQTLGLGAGSEADLDLLLYRDADTNRPPLAYSAAPQGTSGAPSGDPCEVLSYTNPGGAKTVYLAVNHYAGVRNNRMRVVLSSNSWPGLSFPSGGVTDMTMSGHPTAAECVAVGAIFYGDIKDNGTYAGDNTDTVNINAEAFSSKGGIGTNGIEFYFDTAGNPLAGAPVKRDKPDLAAPDGTNTSVFGTDIAYDPDTLPNFFGTSAAAPNAAAVAALLREKTPGLTPAEIVLIMKLSARDIVATKPVSVAGPDDLTGAGLVDALAATSLSVWDGGGADDYWKTAANWVGDVAPSPGNHLVFRGTVRTTPVNDFPGNTTFGSIRFSAGGFTLSNLGSPVTLSGSTAINNETGTNAVNLPLALASPGGTTLRIAAGTALTVGGTVSNGGFMLTAATDTGGACSASGAIGGSGGLSKIGAGTLTLSGANAYTGATTVTGGTLKAGVAAQAFGMNSRVTLANTAGATLDITGFSNSIGSLTGGGTNGGNVTLGAATLTVGGDGTSPAAYAGAIGGTGGLTKIGAGTLTLSGASTYSGGTTVSAGTLLVNNTIGSGTGSGGVSVSTSATLGGTGAVGGAVTVASGGFVSPGAGGVGTLTAASADFSGGGVLLLEVLNGGGCDVFRLTGALTAGGSSVLKLASVPTTGLPVTVTVANYASHAGEFLIDNASTTGVWATYATDALRLTFDNANFLSLEWDATTVDSSHGFPGATAAALWMLSGISWGSQHYTTDDPLLRLVVKNPGGVNEELTVTCSNTSGWTLGATAGTNTFEAGVSTTHGPPYTSLDTATSPGGVVIRPSPGLRINDTQRFDLHFRAPTATTNHSTGAVTVTVTASMPP